MAGLAHPGRPMLKYSGKMRRLSSLTILWNEFDLLSLEGGN